MSRLVENEAEGLNLYREGDVYQTQTYKVTARLLALGKCTDFIHVTWPTPIRNRSDEEALSGFRRVQPHTHGSVKRYESSES